MKGKLYFIIALTFLFFVFGFIIFHLYSYDFVAYHPFTSGSILKVKESPEIILVAFGDIMLNRGVEYMIKMKGENDFRFPFYKISNYLNEADILFANLESVISDKGTKVGSIYSFRADPRAMDTLVYGGFDIVSVANNHTFDYGRLAMEDSFSRLEEAGIIYLGGGFNEIEAFSMRVIEKEGIKIGFLGYSQFGHYRAGADASGIAVVNNESDLERVIKDINKFKDEVDVLIVSFHWGDEYMLLPNYFQKEYGRKIIDAGADLIIGHHPHVIQPVENYNNGWIAYSLGNFVFDQGFSKETMEGLSLEVIITKEGIKEVRGREYKINDFFQPYFDL